jgi:hypothetical protein
MNSNQIQWSTPLKLSDKGLLGSSVLVLLLSMILAITLGGSVPGLWRKVGCCLGVIGFLASPNLLLIGCWKAFRYERSWRMGSAIALSLVATILSWGVSVLYATGTFGFNR